MSAQGAAADAGAAPFRYDARLANAIETRWQDWWEAHGTFWSPNPSGPLADGFERMEGRGKAYVLDMFPYPSGAGLHVGHPLGYIATDVVARYLRMTGHHVLHTFGYDAFGLPAEQYAIDTGQHPAVTTRDNIEQMRRQLRRLGLGHDARREVATSEPSFYRWTQWIFLKIWDSWYDERAGRARPVADLIAEFSSGQRATPDGRPWAALPQSERRDVVDALRLAYRSEQLVNWCPALGTVLANEEVTADGRSDIGNHPVYRRPLRQWMLRITAFAERLIDDLDLVDWPEPIKQMQRNWIGASDGAWIDFRLAGSRLDPIRVFTTRPDTLPGATYLVLAPGHPLADRIAPASWPAGIPRHWTCPQDRPPDSADWTPQDAVRAWRERAARLTDRKRTSSARGKTGIFTGRYAVNPATGEPVPVFLADYVLTGYGTGAIMGVPAHDERDLEFAAQFGIAVDTRTVPGGVAAAIGWLEDHRAGQRARSFRLRDWLFSRQRYWGEPFPIVYDDSDQPVGLTEDMLPVLLPDMADFRPEPRAADTGVPVPPLARARDWAGVDLDIGDGLRHYRRELNTMPQWAGSCWYYLRYLDPANEHALVDRDVERYWMTQPGAAPGDGGVDLYVGGVEHAVLHLLYARFWHKVLYDLGYVSTREPFQRLYNQGYILADAFTDSRGRYVPAAEVTARADGGCTYRGQPVTRRAGKMGKSLKNSVRPDEIYIRYGADTLRLYEMAMGPLDADRPWRTDDIVGMHRFLQRLWRAIVDESTGEARVSDLPLDADTERRLHRTIAIVRQDFAGLAFNTAIARIIELVGHATRLRAREGVVPRALAEPLVLMIAPLAPHIAEELWLRLGHGDSLAYQPFPEPDDELLTEQRLLLPVQVNGKTRTTIEVSATAGEEEIRQILAADDRVAGHVGTAEVLRLIVVPGKIVSIVTR